MTIETIGPIQPIIKIDGEPYVINLKEYESLVHQCQQFMDADNESMFVMTQIIADQLVDSAKDSTKMEELRPQLKFLRELGFFFRGLVSPVPNSNPDQE